MLMFDWIDLDIKFGEFYIIWQIIDDIHQTPAYWIPITNTA